MTHKWAGVGMHYGGGKAVLAVPLLLADNERIGLLERYGDLLRQLHGAYATGADLGTGTEEMTIIATRTRWVHGFDPKTGDPLDPGPFTAAGVRGGIRGALGHLFGERDPARRVILVEGVGGVGAPLARRLAEDGAKLLLADLDQGKAERLAEELGAETVPFRDVVSTRCDVYAPCAVGATLNAETIPRLGCHVVAGSANNQLAETADADLLAKRGILYVPDFIVNAGGAMGVCLLEEGRDPEAVRARVEGLEDTVFALLSEATSSRTTPLEAARKHVEATLRAAKASERSWS
jgi:leucine dehydrogenase